MRIQMLQDIFFLQIAADFDEFFFFLSSKILKSKVRSIEINAALSIRKNGAMKRWGVLYGDVASCLFRVAMS